MATGRSEGSVRHRIAQAHGCSPCRACARRWSRRVLSRAHALALLEALAEVPDAPAAPGRRRRGGAGAPGDGPAPERPSPGQLAGRVRPPGTGSTRSAVATRAGAAVEARSVWVRHLVAPGVSGLGATHTAESRGRRQGPAGLAASRPVDPDDLRTAAQREADLALALLTHGELPGTVLPAAASCS